MRWGWRRERPREQQRFLTVEMDITNHCNLRCKMCNFADSDVWSRPHRDLSVPEFQRIAEQIFPRALRASLSVGTEPLLNRHFREIATIASLYGVPSLFLNTSGLLLTRTIAECLVENGFHALGISMDGATAATYERIRVGSRFETVINNIRTLNQVKARAGSLAPVVTLNFVMMRSNIRELPAFIELAHSLEVPNVNAMHLVPFANLGNQHEALIHDKTLCNDMLDQARIVACKRGMTFCEPGNFRDGESVIPIDMIERSAVRGHGLAVTRPHVVGARCPFPWHFVAIDGDGGVRPCGWWHNEAVVGNILHETFDEIWNGEGYRRIRQEHLDGTLRTVCHQCPAAGLGALDDERAFAAR